MKNKLIIKRQWVMKYKVGDTVQIRTDLVKFKRYGFDTFVDEMLPYLGIITEIINKNSKYYNLKCDNGDWNWTDEMLE